MALRVGYRLRECRECNWEGIADLRFERDEKQIPRAPALGMTALGVKATEGFLRAMVRDEENARFATLTVTIGECRAEARRYVKTLKAKADPSRCGARDDSARREGHRGIPPRDGPRREQRALRHAHDDNNGMPERRAVELS